jgi:hypothetical protein
LIFLPVLAQPFPTVFPKRAIPFPDVLGSRLTASRSRILA